MYGKMDRKRDRQVDQTDKLIDKSIVAVDKDRQANTDKHL